MTEVIKIDIDAHFVRTSTINEQLISFVSGHCVRETEEPDDKKFHECVPTIAAIATLMQAMWDDAWLHDTRQMSVIFRWQDNHCTLTSDKRDIDGEVIVTLAADLIFEK